MLQKHFDLKVLGKTRKLLGIEFEEVGDRLLIHPSSYIDKVCSLYSRFKFPTSFLSIPKGTILSKFDSPTNQLEIDEVSRFPYRNLI